MKTIDTFDDVDEFLSYTQNTLEDTKYNGLTSVLAEYEEIIDYIITSKTDVQLDTFDVGFVLFTEIDHRDTLVHYLQRSENFSQADAYEIYYHVNEWIVSLLEAYCTSDKEVIEMITELYSLVHQYTPDEENKLQEKLQTQFKEITNKQSVEEFISGMDLFHIPSALLQIRNINRDLLQDTLYAVQYMNGNEPEVGEYIIYELPKLTKSEYELLQKSQKSEHRIDTNEIDIPDNLEFVKNNQDREYYRIICKITGSEYDEMRGYNAYSYYILSHDTDVREFYSKHPIFDEETPIIPSAQSEYITVSENPIGEYELISDSSLIQPDKLVRYVFS